MTMLKEKKFTEGVEESEKDEKGYTPLEGK